MTAQYVIHRDGTSEPFEDEQKFRDMVDLLKDQDVDFETETIENEGEVSDSESEGGFRSSGAKDEQQDDLTDHISDGDNTDDMREATPVEANGRPENGDAAEVVVSDNGSVANRAIDGYKDPIPNLPGWMKEEVREHGGMDLNKDGCQVIANALDFEVNAEADVKAHETEFEYACYTAEVEREDGRVFTAVGDCHIEESGKGKKDLNRMAETRAKKRAVKWATAGGFEPFVGGEND